MAFDLSTATPVSSGFDLSTAVPVTAAAVAKDNGMPISRREQAYREGRALGDVDLGEAAAAGARGVIKSPGVIGDVLALPLNAARTVVARNPREQVQGQQPVATDRSSGISEILPTSENIGKLLGLGTTPDRYAGMEFLGSMAGPSVLMKGAKATINLGGRALNAAENTVFTGMGLNKLGKTVGNTGPDLINALRRNREIAGVETGAEAAAGVGNVDLSRYAAGYEKGQPYADIATRKAELLKTQAPSAEAAMTKDAQAVASDIAAPNQSEVGKDLTGIAKQTREQVRNDITRPAYAVAFKAAGDAKIDASGVVTKAEEILGKPLANFSTDAMPETVELLSKLKSTGPTITDSTGAVISRPKVQGTLEQLDKVRKAINNDIASAQTSLVPGAATKLKNLKDLHNAIDEAVMNSTSLDDMQKSLYQNALDRYRADYAPRFKTGEAAKIFERRTRNMTGINDEDVAAALVKGPTEAKSFVAMIGDNPSALQKAQEGIEGIYRDKVIKDGVIDQTAHNAFMQKYGPQIDILDNAGMNLKDKLNTAAQNTEAALAPKATIEEVKKVGGNAILPEGPKAVQMAADVNAAMQKLSPEDIDAVAQIARRAQAYKNMKSPATGLDEVNKPQFLSTAKRAVSEIYAALAQKLGDRQALRISELLSTPEGTQAFIEQALKHKATQAGRVTVGNNFNSPYASVLGLNALVPQRTNQNELRR